MKNGIFETSQRQAAVAAGLGLLLMTLAYMLSDFLVFQKLIVHEDALKTVNNIGASGGLFRVGICGLVIVAICDVVVAWALYVFLSPVNRNLSLLAGWFRLAYSILLVLALFNYVGVLNLLSGAEYLNAVGTGQLQAIVMVSLLTFKNEWSIGLLIFGFHLVFVGYLCLKSGFIPKVFGVLLLIAGPAYVIDGFGKLLAPNYSLDLINILGWGELALMFWLLLKGGRTPNQPLHQTNKKRGGW